MVNRDKTRRDVVGCANAAARYDEWLGEHVGQRRFGHRLFTPGRIINRRYVVSGAVQVLHVQITVPAWSAVLVIVSPDEYRQLINALVVAAHLFPECVTRIDFRVNIFVV